MKNNNYSIDSVPETVSDDEEIIDNDNSVLEFNDNNDNEQDKRSILNHNIVAQSLKKNTPTTVSLHSVIKVDESNNKVPNIKEIDDKEKKLTPLLKTKTIFRNKNNKNNNKKKIIPLPKEKITTNYKNRRIIRSNGGRLLKGKITTNDKNNKHIEIKRIIITNGSRPNVITKYKHKIENTKTNNHDIPDFSDDTELVIIRDPDKGYRDDIVDKNLYNEYKKNTGLDNDPIDEVIMYEKPKSKTKQGKIISVPRCDAERCHQLENCLFLGEDTWKNKLAEDRKYICKNYTTMLKVIQQ